MAVLSFQFCRGLGTKEIHQTRGKIMDNDIVSKIKAGFQTKPGRVVAIILQVGVAVSSIDLALHTTGTIQLIAGTCLTLMLFNCIFQIFECVKRIE